MNKLAQWLKRNRTALVVAAIATTTVAPMTRDAVTAAQHAVDVIINSASGAEAK